MCEFGCMRMKQREKEKWRIYYNTHDSFKLNALNHSSLKMEFSRFVSTSNQRKEYLHTAHGWWRALAHQPHKKAFSIF